MQKRWFWPVPPRSDLSPLMNDTKWNEVRLYMYDMTETPGFTITRIDGTVERIDREWYYHFRAGGYRDILHVDITTEGTSQLNEVLRRLRAVNVPGIVAKNGVRVFGYLKPGQTVNYV